MRATLIQKRALGSCTLCVGRLFQSCTRCTKYKLVAVGMCYALSRSRSARSLAVIQLCVSASALVSECWCQKQRCQWCCVKTDMRGAKGFERPPLQTALIYVPVTARRPLCAPRLREHYKDRGKGRSAGRMLAARSQDNSTILGAKLRTSHHATSRAPWAGRS